MNPNMATGNRTPMGSHPKWVAAKPVPVNIAAGTAPRQLLRARKTKPRKRSSSPSGTATATITTTSTACDVLWWAAKRSVIFGPSSPRPSTPTHAVVKTKRLSHTATASAAARTSPYYNARPGIAAVATRARPARTVAKVTAMAGHAVHGLHRRAPREPELLHFDGLRSGVPGPLPLRIKSSGTLSPHLLTILLALSGRASTDPIGQRP